MAASAFIPVAVFVLVVGTIGWRLLALWRRTRELPELLLGLGLVLMSTVAIPLAGTGRIPGIAETSFGRICFASGMIVIAVSASLLISFTQRVFRAGSAWARSFAVALSISILCAVIWMSYVNFVGGTVAEIIPRMRLGTVALMGCTLVCFAWAGVESFRYHGKLEKRCALGLADPVLVDRFYLWGVSSGANTVLLSLLIYFAGSGMVILREPLPLTAIAVIGSVMSGAWYLTFLAPESYIEYVRNRAARA